MKRNLNTRRRHTRQLGLEDLESRRLMAASIGYSSSSDTVSIYGDSWNNSATVRMSGSKVVVQVVSTPSEGFSLTPSIVTREFSRLSDVDKINFYGRDGDDRFVSYVRTVPVYASGGNGDDYLETYDGQDTIYGGAGNDTIKAFGGNDVVQGGSGNDVIYGGSGDDNLYGDSGADTIRGGSGNDGLYGGAGTDQLFGESGADRFLIMDGSSEHKDARTEDAVVVFRNGNKSWSEEEIEDVDVGLSILHKKTGNDNLMEQKNGGRIVFERRGSSGTTLGSNNSAGRIIMYDRAFASADRTAATTVHEIAHNWDTEHSDWSAWKGISGWRSTATTNSSYRKASDTDEDWWYLRSASFSSGYARTNPREDWAESWQNYFVDKGNLSNIENMGRLSDAKTRHLDAFFAGLS